MQGVLHEDVGWKTCPSLLSNWGGGSLFRHHGVPRVAVCFLFRDSTTSAEQAGHCDPRLRHS